MGPSPEIIHPKGERKPAELPRKVAIIEWRPAEVVEGEDYVTSPNVKG